MQNLTFVRFAAEHLPLYIGWYDDAETQRWMALPDERWFKYVTTSPGNFAWMVYEGETAIGQAQVGWYEEDASQASLAIVTAPGYRRQGYGSRLLRALLGQPELADVARFHAFVEPDNHASLRLVENVGFQLASAQPDEEGFLKYTYTPNV